MVQKLTRDRGKVLSALTAERMLGTLLFGVEQNPLGGTLSYLRKTFTVPPRM